MMMRGGLMTLTSFDEGFNDFNDCVLGEKNF